MQRRIILTRTMCITMITIMYTRTTITTAQPT